MKKVTVLAALKALIQLSTNDLRRPDSPWPSAIADARIALDRVNDKADARLTAALRGIVEAHRNVVSSAQQDARALLVQLGLIDGTPVKSATMPTNVYTTHNRAATYAEGADEIAKKLDRSGKKGKSK
jgi:membrane-bound lytic murein transglycosylase B